MRTSLQARLLRQVQLHSSKSCVWNVWSPQQQVLTFKALISQTSTSHLLFPQDGYISKSYSSIAKGKSQTCRQITWLNQSIKRNNLDPDNSGAHAGEMCVYHHAGTLGHYPLPQQISQYLLSLRLSAEIIWIAGGCLGWIRRHGLVGKGVLLGAGPEVLKAHGIFS